MGLERLTCSRGSGSREGARLLRQLDVALAHSVSANEGSVAVRLARASTQIACLGQRLC